VLLLLLLQYEAVRGHAQSRGVPTPERTRSIEAERSALLAAQGGELSSGVANQRLAALTAARQTQEHELREADARAERQRKLRQVIIILCYTMLAMLV